MRLFFCAFILFCSFGDLTAQTDPESPVALEVVSPKKKISMHFELGLNAPLLFGQLLNENSENTSQPNPYLLTGKILFGKLGIRAGVGGHFNKSIEREGMFADSETKESLGVEVRGGVEWQHAFGQRWNGTFGVDGIFFSHKDQTILDSGFDEVSTGTSGSGWGVGPVFGIQFSITDRLSLLSEGAFYYTQSDTQTSRLFKNFPEFDDELGSIESTGLRINLPTTFFIVYRF